jgi:hypothetical protein
MCARQSPERKPGHARRAAGGGRARLEPAHPHPCWLYEIDGSPAPDLGLHGRAGSRRQRARHSLPGRPGIGRFQLHQRHDLCPRPARGFRPLGAARQSRLGLGRRAPVLQKGRGLGGRCRRIPRRGRPAAHLADCRQAAALRENHRSRHRDRPRIPRRRQSPAARRRGQHRLGAADSPRAPAAKRGAHLSAPGAETPEPANRHQCAGAPRAVRRYPRGRRRVRARRHGRARERRA